jgi:uncharacterized membrane protein YuzA (DUF378 family)
MLNLITFTKLLLVIGGIAWGIYGAFGINIVKRILPDSNAQKIVYILVGVSAVVLLFNRNFYLPFLDKTVLPSSLLSKEKTVIGSDTFTVKVKVEPNVRVIYWASEPKSEIVPVATAYGEFENSGIVNADENGIASLVLKKPSSYTVKKGLFNKTLKPHIHYRYTLSNGMLSEVKTKYVSKKDFSENKINSSSESKSSKSSSESKSSPKSDLTHLNNCDCPHRHLYIHEHGCKVKFNNSIIIPSKLRDANHIHPKINIENVTITDSSSSTKIDNNTFLNNEEINRSLNLILKDRDLSKV